jgi:hypothetical protein
MQATELAAQAERLEGGQVSRSLDKRSGLLGGRVDLDSDTVQHDLARLVLGLVEVIRQLIERQALRRVEGGRLTEEQIERLGLTLMRLEGRMNELKDHFGVTGEELSLDLGGIIEEI